MARFNGETHELIMLWGGMAAFGVSVSAIVLLIIEVVGWSYDPHDNQNTLMAHADEQRAHDMEPE